MKKSSSPQVIQMNHMGVSRQSIVQNDFQTFSIAFFSHHRSIQEHSTNIIQFSPDVFFRIIMLFVGMTRTKFLNHHHHHHYYHVIHVSRSIDSSTHDFYSLS